MFDRLEDTLVRFEELLSMLSEPDVANDPKRFQKLMKEQADLAPIVTKHTKNIKKTSRTSRTVLPCCRRRAMRNCVNLPKKNWPSPKKKIEELRTEIKNSVASERSER